MKILKCTPEIIENYKEQFIELYKQLIYVHYPEKIDQGILTITDYEQSIEKISRYIAVQEGIVFIAQEEELIYGYVHGYIRSFLDEKRMMLDGIVVHNQYKGKNIGKQLEKALEEYAIENNCDGMELFVTTNNPSGEAFHRSNGFIDSRLHMIKKL